VDTQNFPVSCICETAGHVKRIGLRKVERISDWGKKYYRPTLSFGLSKLGATSSSPYHTKVDETILNRESDCFAYLWEKVPCTEN